MEERKQQQIMHKDLFDKAKAAYEQGFYFETIMLCYAAIEGRLEVMMGLLGAPCHQKLQYDKRRKISISHRIKCAKSAYATISFEKTKWTNVNFKDLSEWVKSRNMFVHGLYKDVAKYDSRNIGVQGLAKNGLELTRLLYNEIKRLRRLTQNSAEADWGFTCRNENCKNAVT